MCHATMISVNVRCSKLSTPRRVHCLPSVIAGKILSSRGYCMPNALSREVIAETKTCAWQPPELQKLYEDDWFLAVSKPGSLLASEPCQVHDSKEASKEEKEQRAFLKDLVELQHAQRSELCGNGEGRPLFTVHRLDRGASGVILFAKCSVAAHAAQLALAHEDTVKEYLVLARGSTPDSFICDDPVKDDKGISRSAFTRCEKLLDLPESRCSLLKVYIKTGRWHQIRKHLNHKAFHVIGDGRHGKGRTNQYFRENYQMPLGRCFLHAARLTIPYPSLFSAVCSAKKLPPMGSIGAFNIPEIQSEQILNNLFSLEDRMSGFPVFPKTLTLRASIPADLRQVLLALPDGLSVGLLDSFEAAA